MTTNPLKTILKSNEGITIQSTFSCCWLFLIGGITSIISALVNVSFQAIKQRWQSYEEFENRIV